MEATAGTLIQTPLVDLHRSAGAAMGAWFGCALPNDWGDWRAEYRFARESVALLDKNYRAYISLTGPDRARYLNAILTNNIKELRPGQGTVSLLLNPQGHILAEIEIYALQDTLLCVSYAMIREQLIPALDKYIIMDDVTLTDETPRFGTLALEGPQAAGVVRELTGVDIGTLPELGHVELPRFPLQASGEKAATRGALPCRLVKRSPGGIPGSEFVVEREHLPELWAILLAAVRAQGGGPMGYTALNALRLEQGAPWFGYDFGEKQIPHEAGLQDTHISFTKGCYTGQEIVERVRSRGQVNRVRVLLKFAAGQPPAADTPLLAEGKEVGYVTRTAFSPMLGCAIGMGYVRREHSAAGSNLISGGLSANVIDLPVSPDSRS
jgi:folate-binding protein YgfZ